MNKKTSSMRFTSAIVFAITPILLLAQSKEKTYRENYPAGPSSSVWIDHQRGDLLVEKSSDGQLHIDLQVRVTGSNEQELDLLFESIQIESQISGNEIRIKTKTEIVSWSEMSGRTKVKLKSGQVLKDLKDLEMVMVVKTPFLNFLALANKYEKIEIREPLNFHTSIDIYSGEVLTKGLEGDLDLKSKYSTVILGDINNGNFDLYESRITGGQAGKMQINSKYSSINLANTRTLDTDSYEDKYIIGDIQGDIKIRDKYSDFQLGNLENATLTLYETDLQLKDLDSIVIDSKYASLRIGAVSSCHLTDSYETAIIMKAVGSLIADRDKYGSYEIETLRKTFRMVGYESAVTVSSVENTFEEISIESKYDRMRFGIEPNLKYNLDVDLKYGSVGFHDGIFGHLDKSEKGENLVIKATGSTAKAPLVSLRGYETDFVLK